MLLIIIGLLVSIAFLALCSIIARLALGQYYSFSLSRAGWGILAGSCCIWDINKCPCGACGDSRC